jgi:hypothetical protein
LLAAGFEDCRQSRGLRLRRRSFAVRYPGEREQRPPARFAFAPLLPRLGYFVGHEDRVPFDFDEIVALVAPKPALIVAPSLDRYARVADVEREMEPCKRVYALLGRPVALSFETPEEFNRFPRRMQERVVDWLVRL